jgi:hypothetical protein
MHDLQGTGPQLITCLFLSAPWRSRLTRPCCHPRSMRTQYHRANMRRGRHAKEDTPGTRLLTVDDLRPELLGSKPIPGQAGGAR